ncbi:MAG: hypothetical protein QOK31_1278 [Solirubrobacteraceae bacterium]|jgi:peptidoglycan/LPS O-acetylase OafA/YrhL|nr:hypothetical protein [Solirubrobacteraceae bacterium]
MRTPVLLAALGFIGLLAFLTIYVIASRGFDVFVALSLLVLAMFAFGIVGALRHPPEE